MLHPSISKGGTILNGIYANQFAPSNAQTAPVPFRVNQLDKLTLSYLESFAIIATMAGGSGYTFKAKVNGAAITAAHMLARSTTGITIADGGVMTYDGTGTATLTSGGDNTNPLVGGFTYEVSDLSVLSGKTNNFTLSLGGTRDLYNFVIQSANSVKLYVRNESSWDLVGTYAFGHTIISTDTVAYHVTASTIELLVNGTSVWSKARTWTAVLSSADLGVLSATAPYTFGNTVDLTIGSVAGSYTLSFYNQEGAQTALKLDQSIEVSTDKAATTPAAIDLTIPVVAASVLGTKSEATSTSASTDWGKILTWGGIALAGIVVVAGLIWAIRSKK
ncbi:hypothetical protein GO755_33405 [Spirosoma sp. HMF4905]|uniref:Uncharacterized protein n=1 Tax=Spirosoma arboris TaxID=2682092 RepID=A0A7K1SMS9_9BACT|nr:hypothetical protein [Spirosoma arboris]MVM34973.1 hypothetical protein [Spirosoma arboris]